MSAFYHHGLRKPHFSSDYSFFLESKKQGQATAAFAVLDTIGRPGRHTVHQVIRSLEQRCRVLMRDRSVADASDMLQPLREEMLEGNRVLCALNRDTPERVLGLCLFLGVLDAGGLHYLWLGDCRAYRLSFEHGEPAVRCLTEDHNRLHKTLEAAPASYTFLKNEFSELSRTLTGYWGMPSEDDLITLLGRCTRTIEWRPGDVALAMTDGLYLPILRALMEHQQSQLNREEYYLEEWLNRFLREGRFAAIPSPDRRIKKILRALARYTRGFLRFMPRYRDDIAALGVMRAT